MKKTYKSEYETFDEAVKRILSVPKPELKKREEEWKKEQATKKRDRASDPASPGLAAGRPVSG